MAPKHPAENEKGGPAKKVKTGNTILFVNSSAGNTQPNTQPSHIPTPRTSVGNAFAPTSTPAHGFLAHVRERFYPSPLGISNPLGTQCYLNASLILLLTSKRFLGYLRGWHMTREIISGAQGGGRYHHVLEILNGISNVIYDDGSDRLSVTRKRDTIQKAVGRLWLAVCCPNWLPIKQDIPGCAQTQTWAKPGQQDANEFMYWLLGCAKEQLEVSQFAVNNFRSLLECQLSTRMVCTRCNWRVKRRNIDPSAGSELMLRLHAPPVGNQPVAQQRRVVIPLEDCIRDYMTQRETNPIRCPRCKHSLENRGYVMNTIQYAPEILLIALPREQVHPGVDPVTSEGLTAGKSHVAIKIPETLNVTPWLEPSKFGKTSRVLYRLHGVVSHSGENMAAGHYIANVRSGNLASFWYNVNDDTVTQTGLDSFDDSDISGYTSDEAFQSRFEPHTLLYEFDWENSRQFEGRQLMNLGEGNDIDERPSDWITDADRR